MTGRSAGSASMATGIIAYIATTFGSFLLMMLLGHVLTGVIGYPWGFLVVIAVMGWLVAFLLAWLTSE